MKACSMLRVVTILSLAVSPAWAEANKPESPAASTQPAALAEFKRLVDRADERVSVLDNGLKVLLKVHRTAPVVSVRMYCQTGSIYEQEYLGSGMSHLFEHLLHGGATRTRTEEESREVLDQIGGNTNAYTSYDMTCYFINTAKEHMERALQLLGDWITDPTFPQGAFEREWGVVQRELERDIDNPDRQLFQLTMETMYREHPARYPIIGYQPVVQKLKKEDIVGYYHRMYVPDNIVVCIAGDIDLDRTLSAVQNNFAAFSRRRVPNIVLPQEPEMTTPREAGKRMKTQAAMMQLAYPSIPLIHPDLYALDLLSYVLTQGDSSRLVRTIRDAGLVFSIDSSSWTPAWARGVFGISARLAPEKMDAAKAAILEQIALVQRDLISPEELAQAKKQKASEHVFSSQTAESVAEMMVNDFISTGDTHFSQSYVDRIQEVTAEQVREMARKYLLPDRLATIRVVPEDYNLTTREAEKTAATEPIRMLKFDNGLRVLLRRDTTTPLVAIQCFSLGGVLLEDEKTNGLSRLTALLAPRGTENLTAEQISRYFDSHGVQFNGTSGSNSIYFQIQALKKDYPESLRVLSEIVCRPKFPSDELEKIRPRALDQIAAIDETWRPELMAFLQKVLFPNSPYRFQPAGSVDVVSKATAKDIADFHHRCVTAPNTVLAVFGDVEPAKVRAMVRSYFGMMPNEKPALPKVTEEGGSSEPVLYVKPKGPTRNVAGVGLGFHGMTFMDPDDVVATTVLDTIISGYRYPGGWLHEALRGRDKSLVYEVHAQNIPGLVPGQFSIYAACEPTQVNEVYRIIAHELDRARAGEFTPAELEQARIIITTTELMENQTNSERAMQAALDELYGLGFNYRERFGERVRAVTLDDVKRMASKYLTIPTVAIVTPTPDKIDLGIKTVHVEEQAASPKPSPAGGG